MRSAAIASWLTSPFRSAVIVLCVVGVTAAFALLDACMRRRNLALAEQVGAEVARREAEQELASARQVFLSMVSHEMKTPASTIIGGIDVMRSRRRGPGAVVTAEEEKQECDVLDMMADSAGHILSLVRNSCDAPRRLAAMEGRLPVFHVCGRFFCVKCRWRTLSRRSVESAMIHLLVREWASAWRPLV